MPSVFTEHGPTLEDEVSWDAKVIDRKLVRFCLRFRPDWTGVRYHCNARVSYSVGGQLFAYEEPLGLLAINATKLELAKVQKRAVELKKRLEGMCKEHGLELRGASLE